MILDVSFTLIYDAYRADITNDDCQLIVNG
jgi:hypothetical protein